MRIFFKNLISSQMTKDFVKFRLSHVLEKFPHLFGHRIDVVLEMLNSPNQAGADCFAVRVTIGGKKYRNICIESRNEHLFAALATVCDKLLENLNRTGDRARVKKRAAERRWKEEANLVDENEDTPPTLVLPHAA